MSKAEIEDDGRGKLSMTDLFVGIGGVDATVVVPMPLCQEFSMAGRRQEGQR